MGLARSTFYDVVPVPLESRRACRSDRRDLRRVRVLRLSARWGGAAPQGVVVNSKKRRRLMREHDLQPKRRRRYVVTTDSDHAGPIFPDLAKSVASMLESQRKASARRRAPGPGTVRRPSPAGSRERACWQCRASQQSDGL
jgi:hypothetical protein